MENFVERKPHAVLVPGPGQGHINPFLKLAKLLHLRGFHITFVNTEYNHKRLLKSRGSNALDGFTHFCFESIPDGLTPTEGDGDVSQHLPSLFESIRKNFLKPFSELLARLHESANASRIPHVTCLVSDLFMSFTIKAAKQFALPNVLFYPASASSLWNILHFPSFVEKRLVPLKDESYLTNEYLETQVDSIPGLIHFRLKDIVDIRKMDPNDIMIEFFNDMADKVDKESNIILNTFHELESDAINALFSMCPSLYPIGLLPLLLNQTPHNHQLASLDSNLLKDDTMCLEWLESKEAESVVYVNFGSVIVMSREQLLEFAWGLANSKKPFLWIIRPDIVIGGLEVLSSEYVNEISDRGLIESWCPQEKVLNHRSIGGFLTHCGWNSITESLCAGVPMLCWPFIGDQLTNSGLICNELEVGIEIDKNVKREEVEKLINELMVGEKGKKMRQKAMKLKKKAKGNTSPGGCSYMNLDKVIKEVMLKQN